VLVAGFISHFEQDWGIHATPIFSTGWALSGG
jgi:hypothetical protein